MVAPVSSSPQVQEPRDLPELRELSPPRSACDREDPLPTYERDPRTSRGCPMKSPLQRPESWVGEASPLQLTCGEQRG